MSLFNNYFHFSNKSCYDNRQNDWFKNGIGNYWKGMDLPDIDGNGISETSVKIPGGTSEDKYPLVPNVHLDLIPSQSYGTTGEIISLDVIAEPTIFNEVKSLNLNYGNKTYGFTHMRLDPKMEHQSVLIGIPTNMTGAIELFLNATDKYGMVTESIHRSIDIHDNDPPEILLVECPDQVGNGDHFNILIKAIDNIEISRINASVRLVDDEWTVPLIGTGNDTWTLEMDADQFIVYPYNITFEAYDTSNNYARLRNIEVRIIDTVYPELVRDLTLSEGGTGQLFGFVAEITDNDALGKVEVEYKQGTTGETVEMKQNLNVFHADIRLSKDSVAPLTYRFVIKDLSGNKITTEERTVTIKDVLFPEIELGEYPGEVGTGEELSFEWSTSDNIGVVNSTVLIFRDEILIGTGAGESIKFIIPVDHLGNIVFRIVVRDGAGNERTFNSTPIRIIDTIFPEATLEGKLEWFEGDEIGLTINATDNIAIENIVWRCSGKEGFGGIIKLEFDEPGEYLLEVEVSDTSGNVQLLRENITILENDGTDGTSIGLYLIAGAIILILIVILITLFFFFRRRSGNDDLKEEGLDTMINVSPENTSSHEKPTESIETGSEE